MIAHVISGSLSSRLLLTKNSARFKYVLALSQLLSLAIVHDGKAWQTYCIRKVSDIKESQRRKKKPWHLSFFYLDKLSMAYNLVPVPTGGSDCGMWNKMAARYNPTQFYSRILDLISVLLERSLKTMLEKWVNRPYLRINIYKFKCRRS